MAVNAGWGWPAQSLRTPIRSRKEASVLFHDWRRDGHAAVGEHDGCYDSSFTYDTQKKAPLYAKGGVREYWVIDLNSNRVLVYTRPRAGQYSIIRTQNRGDRFTSQRFPGIEFKVRDLLP